MSAPKFSVVIPVFNKRDAVRRAVESVFNCRERQIEAILVDDGSTDGSREEIVRIAEGDSRVRAIFHDVNKSVYQARKTGAAATHGDYVLFLDGDDELAPGAIDAVSALLEEHPVDILHFGMQLIAAPDVDAEKAEAHQRWLTPYHGMLAGHQIMTACLVDSLFCWNLCGKAIRGELCREAFACCSETGSFLRAEDLVAFLMCAYLADSYRGAPSKRLYLYHYGDGGDGGEGMTCEKFERYWGNYPELQDEFDQFLRHVGADERLRQLYLHEFKQLLLRDMGDTLISVVAPLERSRALDLFVDVWGADVATSQIAVSARFDHRTVAIDGAQARLFERIEPQCKNIAVYYSDIMTQPEAEMVYAMASLWRDRGAKVGILIDNPLDARFAALFEDFSVTVTQPRFPLKYEDTRSRFDALSFIVERDSIDTVVYCQWMSHVLIWDLVLFKALGVATIVHFSREFARPCMNPRRYFAWHPFVWALADGITFDKAPTTVYAPPKADDIVSLGWTRACAMLFRSDDAMIPGFAADAIISSVHPHTGS